VFYIIYNIILLVHNSIIYILHAYRYVPRDPFIVRRYGRISSRSRGTGRNIHRLLGINADIWVGITIVYIIIIYCIVLAFLVDDIGVGPTRCGYCHSPYYCAHRVCPRVYNIGPSICICILYTNNNLHVYNVRNVGV